MSTPRSFNKLVQPNKPTCNGNKSANEVPEEKFAHVSEPPLHPFTMSHRSPSILLNHLEFRKITSPGTVLPNALLSCDVDEDGVEEIIIGTTEGCLLVVKDSFFVDLIYTMAATIAVVMYCKELRQLVLVTLEGQCEVWDDFPATLQRRSGDFVEKIQFLNSKNLIRVLESNLKKANNNNIGIARGQANSNFTSYSKIIQKPSNVFHVRSNCMCGDISIEDGVGRLFVGSYDGHLYVYNLCLGTCEISIFMHHAVTSLKCFVLPLAIDHVVDLFSPLENANVSTDDLENKVGRRTATIRATHPAPAFQGSFGSHENIEGVQLADKSSIISIPLLFVATTQRLVLFPASLSMLKSRQDKKNESSKPLVLAHQSFMRDRCYECGNPHTHQELGGSATIYKGESGIFFQAESHTHGKSITSRETNTEGRDGCHNTCPHTCSIRVSQPQRCTASLHYPTIATTTSAITLDFSHRFQTSAQTDSTKQSVSGGNTGKFFNDDEDFEKTLPIDASPSIAFIYPLWSVTIHWHSLNAQLSCSALPLFSIPSHRQLGEPDAERNVEDMIPTHPIGLFQTPQHAHRKKCSLPEADSFLSPSCSSTFSYFSSCSSSNDVIEISRLSNDSAYEGGSRFYDNAPSLTTDHECPVMAEDEHASATNLLLRASSSKETSALLENVRVVPQRKALIRSSFPSPSIPTANSPDSPLSSSCVIQTPPKKEVGPSCSSSAIIDIEKEKVKSARMADHQIEVPRALSAKPSRLHRKKRIECSPSPVFLDVSVDGTSVVLVASREDGYVFVLRLIRNPGKTGAPTTVQAVQNSIDSIHILPSFCTSTKVQKSVHRTQILYQKQALAWPELKPPECKLPEPLTPSRARLPSNKVRIPLSLGKRAKMDLFFDAALHVNPMSSLSTRQSNFKLSNTSLSGYVSKVPSFAVGDELAVPSLVGGQIANPSSHAEAIAEGVLSSNVTAQQLGAEVDILLDVECLWTGLLEGPLVERTSIFQKGGDAIGVALMSASGKCYIINPATSKVTEYSMSPDCSSFVLIKEPLPARSNENFAIMREPLAQPFPSLEHGIFLPNIRDAATPSVRMRSSLSMQNIFGGPYDTVEHGSAVRNSPCNNAPPSCCTSGFAVHVICVNVEELGLYSTNEICGGVIHDHPLHALPNRSPGASSRRRSDEHPLIAEAPSYQPRQRLPFDQNGVIGLFSHYSTVTDDLGNPFHDDGKAGRDLLFESGIGLRSLDAKDEKWEENQSIGLTKVNDVEDLILNAKEALTKGYSAKDWMLLKSMQRNLSQDEP